MGDLKQRPEKFRRCIVSYVLRMWGSLIRRRFWIPEITCELQIAFVQQFRLYQVKGAELTLPPFRPLFRLSFQHTYQYFIFRTNFTRFNTNEKLEKYFEIQLIFYYLYSTEHYLHRTSKKWIPTARFIISLGSNRFHEPVGYYKRRTEFFHVE